MNTVRTAMRMKPTFQELAALIVTVGCLILMGVQIALSQPVDDLLKFLLTAAATYTFGIRSGRASEANHPDENIKALSRIKETSDS